METIGNKIRIQRLTRNYSQEYMAFMLDISQAAYSKIERGETELSIRRIYTIAEVLEISPFTLLPKPKYGMGINGPLILRTLQKIRKAWSGGLKEKRARAKELQLTNSDK